MKELLLQGKIELPSKQEFLDRFDHITVGVVEQMFKDLFYIYLMKGAKGSTSTTYWAERVVEAEGNFKDFNRCLRNLSINGWIIVDTSTKYHWSELRINEGKLIELIGEQQLLQLRVTKKAFKYLPKWRTVTGRSDLVRQNGKTKRTGLIRNGFAMAAMTQFYYDSAKLAENVDEVVSNVNKGMRKCRELRPSMLTSEADYDVIAADIVHQLIEQPQIINIGDSVSDSRGRAIKKALSSVANPIGYKDFRALITIPRSE